MSCPFDNLNIYYNLNTLHISCMMNYKKNKHVKKINIQNNLHKPNDNQDDLQDDFSDIDSGIDSDIDEPIVSVDDWVILDK